MTTATAAPTATGLAPFSPPGTADHAAATAAYQLAEPVDPVAATTARSVQDVVDAVGAAARSGLPLRVSTTGHAAGRTGPLAGSLLLRPLLDGPVRVDPRTRTARIPAGRTWGEVLPEVLPHGLTALHGSSPTVGVVGYLLGGGVSFYGRRYGLAANAVRSLTLALADGRVVEASADEHPELFWALRGGGGGFGVVVEAEVELLPVHAVVTGRAVWDVADAARLAPVWQAWTRTAPPEVSTSLRVLDLPPLPGLPASVAGRRALVLDGAVTATTAADLPAARRTAEDLLGPLRALAEPVEDTWAPAAPGALAHVHLDPPDPVAFRSGTALVGELDDADWPELLDAAAGLVSLELRQLGGAIARPPSAGGVVDRFAAPLLHYAVGPAGAATSERLAAVREVLRPHLTGRTAPGFVDRPDQPQRSYDDETRARVEGVRLAVDPGGLFAGDVAVVRDRVRGEGRG
ncbi:FAD-binding oxidoreductase [Kineococcus terrestris]|uniref:FAD-binding oxidoreductase n=1 Tax=Kineococcus terrestris TaxID=2044856 RepID=UPI0034DB3D07